MVWATNESFGVRQCLGLADPLPRCSGKPTSIFSFGTSVFSEPKRVALL